MKEREILKQKRMDFIKDNHDLNNRQIAEILKCNLSTVRRYRIFLEDKKEIPMKQNFLESLPKEKVDRLVEMYEQGYFLKEISSELDLKLSQINYILKYLRYDKKLEKRLRRPQKRKSRFDDADLCYIIDFYNERTISQIANDLDAPYTTVYGTIERLVAEGKIKRKPKKNNKISEDDKQFIIDNYGKLLIREMAKHLGVCNFCVYYHIERLKSKGLIEPTDEEKQKMTLTEDDVFFIIKNYPYMTSIEMGKHLNKSKFIISGKVKEMINQGVIKETKVKKRKVENEDEKNG